MGTVAANAHHKGNATSASRPINEKLIQNTLRCIASF